MENQRSRTGSILSTVGSGEIALTSLNHASIDMNSVFWDNIYQSLIGESILVDDKEFYVSKLEHDGLERQLYAVLVASPQVRVVAEDDGNAADENVRSNRNTRPGKWKSKLPSFIPRGPFRNSHRGSGKSGKRVPASELLHRRVEFLCRLQQQEQQFSGQRWGKTVPSGVVSLAAHVVRVLSEYQCKIQNIRAKLDGERQNEYRLDQLQAKLVATDDVDIRNAGGMDALKHRKTILQEKIDRKRAALRGRKVELQEELEVLLQERVFPSVDAVCSFFNLNLDLEQLTTALSPSLVMSWVRPENEQEFVSHELTNHDQDSGSATISVEETFLPFNNEESLAILLQELEHRGCVVTREELFDIVREMMLDERSLKQFSGQENAWLDHWIERMNLNGYDLASLLTRAKNKENLSWATPANIHWWYDRVGQRMVDLGVAKPSGDSGCELEWKYPGRVVVTDELEILEQQAVLSRLDKPHRRTSTLPKFRANDHVSLLAGYNLLFEVLPPVWFVSGDKLTKQDVEAAKMATSIDLGPINGQEVEKHGFLAFQEGTSTSLDNEGISTLVDMIKTTYPDVENSDPSLKVIWFFQGSAQDLVKLAKACRGTGVHVVSSFPHCGSRMGCPVAHLFSGFQRLSLDRFSSVVQQRKKRELTNTLVVSNALKLKIGASTLAKLNRLHLCRKGAQKTGFRPFNRTVVLNAAKRRRDKAKLSNDNITQGSICGDSDCTNLSVFGGATSVFGDDDELWSRSSIGCSTPGRTPRKIPQRNRDGSMNLDDSMDTAISLNREELEARLDMLRHRLSTYQQELVTIREQGMREHEANLEILRFDCSLEELAEEQKANHEYEIELEKAEQKRTERIHAAKAASLFKTQEAEKEKCKQETRMKQILGLHESVMKRLPPATTVKRMDDDELYETQHLVFATEKYLKTQKRSIKAQPIPLKVITQLVEDSPKGREMIEEDNQDTEEEDEEEDEEDDLNQTKESSEALVSLEDEEYLESDFLRRFEPKTMSMSKLKNIQFVADF